MLCTFFLLLFFCEGTEQSTTTEWPTTTTAITTSLETSTPTMTTEGHLPSLQLVATPDYPVTEGRTVHLYCGPSTIPDSVNWSWKQWKKEVGNSRDLTLTRPEQSGVYQCFANNTVSSRMSSLHTVSITSTHTTVAEKLGIAAFVFFLLALIVLFGILFWLGFQRLVATKTTSNTAAKGFPGTDKSPKGGFPPAESSGDVYMNYTGDDYNNLDLTNVTGNDYSSLS
ncbi:uncharacterized protein LOC117556445 isoform X2 [Gymnodraco acuticeps]|uniref:Uncharacterized protein LOC117556445 isoform X2 n=1 Tax=Gymnodraco acuticeps TaxID=8218 RepID=A0A6P8VM08_GYMAC|nr:uncharacterized protein LOC117556445 isoform X2 [Gymnodraco acuticeps]